MRVNSMTNYNIPQNRNNVKAKNPTFKSDFLVDASSAASRGQILTLGMLMNTFWIKRARPTFNQVKYSNVYGTFTLSANDIKDPIVERILKNNNIKYTKVAGGTGLYTY